MKGQKGYAIAQTVSFRRLRPALRLTIIWQQVRRWWQLSEQRRLLATLDDSALKDIGLNRADVMQESERPFWDDPLKPKAGFEA
ncbi:DUF1127 domain-containing protein [Aquipseudomonas ullengensis]|uniref:DUF1127 domain-containing protein n=1 Tax=Aquipseudomonas ullengensis TaxID=2759166 RepID=A0A7W4LPP1_9GAMM|nr:DUF1127 domain-containing protein [Pseudomonas ullengensis]MBB2497021.1 DUF1127 domain-containing protein [Pseudomonas ullengensis]